MAGMAGIGRTKAGTQMHDTPRPASSTQTCSNSSPNLHGEMLLLLRQAHS
jgi:hypothetical protein